MAESLKGINPFYFTGSVRTDRSGLVKVWMAIILSFFHLWIPWTSTLFKCFYYYFYLFIDSIWFVLLDYLCPAMAYCVFFVLFFVVLCKYKSNNKKKQTNSRDGKIFQKVVLCVDLSVRCFDMFHFLPPAWRDFFETIQEQWLVLTFEATMRDLFPTGQTTINQSASSSDGTSTSHSDSMS